MSIKEINLFAMDGEIDTIVVGLTVQGDALSALEMKHGALK